LNLIVFVENCCLIIMSCVNIHKDSLLILNFFIELASSGSILRSVKSYYGAVSAFIDDIKMKQYMTAKMICFLFIFIFMHSILDYFNLYALNYFRFVFNNLTNFHMFNGLRMLFYLINWLLKRSWEALIHLVKDLHFEYFL
jgi:hypothetical protein